MANHIWHTCEQEDCPICRGGLADCIVCGCAESSLLTHCPGGQLDAQAQQDIANGRVIDFVWASTRIMQTKRRKS